MGGRLLIYLLLFLDILTAVILLSSSEMQPSSSWWINPKQGKKTINGLWEHGLQISLNRCTWVTGTMVIWTGILVEAALWVGLLGPLQDQTKWPTHPYILEVAVCVYMLPSSNFFANFFPLLKLQHFRILANFQFSCSFCFWYSRSAMYQGWVGHMTRYCL